MKGKFSVPIILIFFMLNAHTELSLYFLFRSPPKRKLGPGYVDYFLVEKELDVGKRLVILDISTSLSQYIPSIKD